MFISELTSYELGKFNTYKKNHTCPICGKTVDVCDGFEMMKIKYVSRTYYAFFHSKCILSQLSRRVANDGEEN